MVSLKVMGAILSQKGGDGSLRPRVIVDNFPNPKNVPAEILSRIAAGETVKFESYLVPHAQFELIQEKIMQLTKFANHLPRCELMEDRGGPCTCGFSEYETKFK